MQKTRYTQYNLFLIDILISLILTFCSFAFILIFGILAAIVNDYSTVTLKWLFAILPICIVIVFAGSLVSQLHHDFISKKNPKEKRSI